MKNKFINNPLELDLHGVKHADVKKVLENFINEKYDFVNKFPQLTIITGNSQQMKNICKELLNEYKFEILDLGPRLLIC